MQRLISPIYAVIFIVAVPFMAEAAAPSTFVQMANMITGYFNVLTTLLVLLGVVIYFVGISQNIFKSSQGEMSAMRSQLLWGLAILFLMVSIWGIISLLENTLFSNSQYQAPSSIPAAPANTFQSAPMSNE